MLYNTYIIKLSLSKANKKMKITKATLKSFAKKNKNNLFIKILSQFDGMVDCVMPIDHPTSSKVDDYEATLERYLVGSSRDYIIAIENGFEVSNCCGHFQITNN
jgi:hypothetical protein